MDDKTKQPPATETPVKAEKPEVEEHPISDADAKKFAGQGDYSLPVSPLDELMVPSEGAAAKEQAEKAAKPVVAPQPQPVQPIISPTKTDTAQPAPKVDLEKKAKDMLKEIGKTADTGSKPKKKRSGTATKMALAAVLMVLMGAGGIAGVNLFKLNQSTENRSQAATCEGTANCGCGNKGVDICATDSNGAKNYFSVSCPPTDCTITCVGQKDCTEEVDPPPADAQCKSADGTVVGGIGATSCEHGADGKNNGSYCKCNYVSETAVWQCQTNLAECPTGGGVNVEKGTCNIGGVTVEGNCLKTENGVVKTFNNYRCDNKSSADGGCQENNNPITGTEACLTVPSNNWCGVQQIDLKYPDCFISSVVPCASNPPNTTAPGCVSTVMSKQTLAPGESMTIVATSKTNSRRFALDFYNLSIATNPNAPPPFLVGGTQLSFVFDASSSPTTTHTFTINYADVYKPDSTDNKIPTEITFLGHLTDVNGKTNSADPNCWGKITITPTVTPDVYSCVSLSKEDKALKVGDKLKLTCASAGTGINHYDFRYRIVDAPSWNEKPVGIVTDQANEKTITLTEAGDYEAECRVCRSTPRIEEGVEVGGDCTNWGEAKL